MNQKIVVLSGLVLCGLLMLCVGITLFSDGGLVKTRGVVTAYGYEALLSRKKVVTVEYRDASHRLHVARATQWQFSRLCHPILAIKGVGTAMTVAYPPEAPEQGRIYLWEEALFESVPGKILLIILLCLTVFHRLKRVMATRNTP